MRAVVLHQFGGPEVLGWSEIPDPTAGPEELLVEVRAFGLNRADLLEREGRYPVPEPRPAHQVPGLEFAGVVAGVGERVLGWRVGDAVMGLVSHGAYAQRLAVHYRMAWRIPAGMAFRDAAAVPEVFLTAYDALFDKAGLTAGERVLIHSGAGGVGSAATQLAKLAGLQVAATVGSDEKVERLRAVLGSRAADLYINYRRERFADRVREWTAGAGVHGILDTVGGPYWNDNISVLATGGIIVVVGTLGGDAASVRLGQVLSRRLTVRGTALRSRPPEAKMALVQGFAERMMPAFQQGRLRPVVDRVFPADALPDAHRYLQGNLPVGKVIVDVGGAEERVAAG